MAIKPIPDGYHSVTPYLIVKGAAGAIEFYKKAFGASEVMRFGGPGGTIGHAEIKIGDSPVMLADEYPDMGSGTLQDPFGHVWTIATHVEDIAPEEMHKRAEEAVKHASK